MFVCIMMLPVREAGFLLRPPAKTCYWEKKDVYMMFFSAADYTIKRTICIARTKNLESAWKIDSLPILPAEEQIENSSLYFEETNQTWFLFTNHIGYDKDGEYTDAIWVYWSRDLNRWNPEHKAVVLDGQNCKWSFRCIGDCHRL